MEQTFRERFRPRRHFTDRRNRIIGKTRQEIERTALPGQIEDQKASFQQWERSLLKRFRGNAKALTDFDPSYNCHSYTFTNGEGGWLDSKQVDTILRDNGYSFIASKDFLRADIQPGDIVVYQDSKGINVHSGVVERVDEEDIYVCSKWGPKGLVEHTIDAVSQSHDTWMIYRTERSGGRLLSAEEG